MVVKNEFRSIVVFLLLMVVMAIACGFMWARLRDPRPVSDSKVELTQEPSALVDIYDNNQTPKDALGSGGQAKINEERIGELQVSVEDLFVLQEQNEKDFVEIRTGLTTLKKDLEGFEQQLQSLENWKVTQSCGAQLELLKSEITKHENEIKPMKTSWVALAILLGVVPGTGLIWGLKLKKRLTVLEKELISQRSRLSKFAVRQEKSGNRRATQPRRLPDDNKPTSLPWLVGEDGSRIKVAGRKEVR